MSVYILARLTEQLTSSNKRCIPQEKTKQKKTSILTKQKHYLRFKAEDQKQVEISQYQIYVTIHLH